MPRVSIILPVRNRRDLLEASIETIFRQTYADWELIVVDHASSDGTDEVIRRFTDSRIRGFRIEGEQSVHGLREFGMRYASGELIAYHDSDDIWSPDKLKRQVEILEAHPESCFVFTNGWHIGEDRDPVSLESFYEGLIFRPMLFGQRFIFFAPSLMYWKRVHEKVGFGHSSELCLLLTMGYHFKGIFTNDRLVGIRKHSASVTASNPEWGYLDYMEMVESFHNQGMLTTAERRMLLVREGYKLARLQKRLGKDREYSQTLMRLLKENPLHLKSIFRLLTS